MALSPAPPYDGMLSRAAQTRALRVLEYETGTAGERSRPRCQRLMASFGRRLVRDTHRCRLAADPRTKERVAFR